MSFDIKKPAPIVLLIKPQMGENIGMCARAMLNCGLKELRIVAPRDGWPNVKANAAASGADDVIKNVRIFDSTIDAIADCHEIIGTTNRPRDMVKSVYTAQSAVPRMHSVVNSGHKACIMFGPERTGLENEDISLCTSVMTIPLNPEFSSLNLAQAVLVASYEWVSQTQFNDMPQHFDRTGASDWAPQKELNHFIKRLDQTLDNYNFYKTKEMRPSVLMNVQNMFVRHKWTSQEVQTLHGMVTAFDKHKSDPNAKS